MPRYRFDDDDVVVIVGSGAGGGTLANELCQKGVKVVVLEAGPPPHARGLRQRRVALVHAAGLAGQPHDVGVVPRRARLPQPARVDVQDRRRHDDALGGLLPALHGARVQGLDLLRGDRGRQRARLADLARRRRALLRPRRGQARHHGHQRHPAAAGQQQLQGVRQRRPAASATSASTPAATRSTPSRATAARRRCRTASRSRATRSAPSGRRSSPSCPRRRPPASSTCGPSRT